MDIVINLTDNKRSYANIETQWIVQVIKDLYDAEIEKSPWKKLFARNQHIEKSIKIGIENISIDKHLICKKDKLFRICQSTNIYEQNQMPISLLLNSKELPFSLFINQQAITDCTESQNNDGKKYPIKFDVAVLDEKGEEINRCSTKVNISFMPLNIQSTENLHFNDDFFNNASIQYAVNIGKLETAWFATWFDSDLTYAPSTNYEIFFKLLKNGKELKDVLSCEQDGKAEVKYTQKPSKKNCKNTPIYIDFSKLSNPISDKDKYMIEATIIKSFDYEQDKKERRQKQFEFEVLKDEQQTELKVAISENRGRQYIDNTQTTNLSEFAFTPQSQLMKQIQIELFNIATYAINAQAGLTIKNLTVSEEIQDDTIILDKDGERVTSILKVTGKNYQNMRGGQGFFIPNSLDAKTQLNVSFDPSRISDVVYCNNYQFKIKSLISFDYIENNNGSNPNGLEVHHFKIPLIWNLHLLPNKEWLCIDYGTSAIVCNYNNQLIDLRMQKNKIMRQAYPQFRNDSIERESQFLSSDIVLHSVDKPTNGYQYSSYCSEQGEDFTNDLAHYNLLSICLSPTSDLIRSHVQTQLPCLKILVGNEFLPENVDYLTFQYPKKDDNGQIIAVEARKTKNDQDSILRISTIFKEAYNALFKFFIFPVAGDVRKLNKVAITYPNTYTPRHLKVLQNIASSTFPYIRKGYLRFVSESDAVAAYYIDNWSTFNPDGDIYKDETVLVYDMGAGTLDITLFKKSSDNGTINVDIIGKLGTGKAGNYLDYVIADIIMDLTDPGFKFLVSTQRAANVGILTSRVEMKQKIKEIIKPSLANNNNFKENDKIFTSEQITTHLKFNAFLREVTTDILKQLCEYIGQETLNIDTIIMSGRSCKLQQLQNELETAIEQISHGSNNFVTFDGAANRLKTVVSEGACAYVDKFSRKDSNVKINSKRIFASYGLIYQVLGGKYKYVELLNHRDVPYSNQFDNFEGQSKVLENTANASSLLLIQTYLSPEQTELSYNNGEFEFISVMEEFDTNNLGRPNQLNAKILLDYNNDISVYIEGLVSHGSSPRGVDLNNEITKRSIWPVTI